MFTEQDQHTRAHLQLSSLKTYQRLLAWDEKEIHQTISHPVEPPAITKFGFCQVCSCRDVLNTQTAWNIVQRAKGKVLMASRLLTVAGAPEHSFLQEMFNCSLLSRTFPSACERNYCFPPLVQSEEVNSPSFFWQQRQLMTRRLS